MTETPTIAAEDLAGKSIAQLTQAYGPPRIETFVLDDNVDEFRVPLLNRFSKEELEGGKVQLTEATFALDDQNNLTVWFHGADYVDHFVYDRLSDF